MTRTKKKPKKPRSRATYIRWAVINLLCSSLNLQNGLTSNSPLWGTLDLLACVFMAVVATWYFRWALEAEPEKP